MLKQIAAPKAIVKTTKYVFPTTIASGNLFTVLQRGIGSFVLILLVFGQQLEYLCALCPGDELPECHHAALRERPQ
jgi:hypothetical protein